MTESGQSYLWFEYFGTGALAEMEHVGNSTHFRESGFTEWLIPVKPGLNLKYKIITIKGVQFYLAHGAKRKSLFRRRRVQDKKRKLRNSKEKTR